MLKVTALAVASAAIVAAAFFTPSLNALAHEALDPVRINPAWCPEYASDAEKAAIMRSAGLSIEQAIAQFETHRSEYPPKMWPHVLLLIKRAYASTTDPVTYHNTVQAECTKNDGVLDQET